MRISRHILALYRPPGSLTYPQYMRSITIAIIAILLKIGPLQYDYNILL